MRYFFISDDVLNYIRRLEDRLRISDHTSVGHHPAASDKSIGGEADGDIDNEDWRRPEAVSNAFKVIGYRIYYVYSIHVFLLPF